MTSIHIKIDVISIRVYEDGNCYENRDKYSGIVTGYALSDTRIHLTSAHGEFSRKLIREIHLKLKDMGFTIITFERHGLIKEKR